MTKKAIFHGECVIRQIDKLPKGLTPVKPENGYVRIAESEVTGNHHQVAVKDKDIEFYEKDGVLYAKINEPTSGNSARTSEQEHYVLALQKINKKIDEYKAWLLPEHQIIKTQIARIKKWNYRKILVYRYLEKWKWAEIVQDFFEFEDDYKEEKDTKYKEKVMYWHRQALAELEKVSSKPYIKQDRQLPLNM